MLETLLNQIYISVRTIISVRSLSPASFERTAVACHLVFYCLF